jgi:hypothetical protein
MAPHVKKAKTAFLYYQADQLSKIRQQLGPAASMGDAMTEVSTSDTSDTSTSVVSRCMLGVLCSCGC